MAQEVRRLAKLVVQVGISGLDGKQATEPGDRIAIWPGGEPLLPVARDLGVVERGATSRPGEGANKLGEHLGELNGCLPHRPVARS